jgi:flagellar motor component MotA
MQPWAYNWYNPIEKKVKKKSMKDNPKKKCLKMELKKIIKKEPNQQPKSTCVHLQNS